MDELDLDELIRWGDGLEGLIHRCCLFQSFDGMGYVIGLLEI
jgi:hypothetical protein